MSCIKPIIFSSFKRTFNNKHVTLLTDKPELTNIQFTSSTAFLGIPVTITCTSFGFPEPRYNIVYNNTTFITTSKSYTIDNVKYTHAGWYKCVAMNRLGSDSKSKYLSIKGKPEFFNNLEAT